MHTGRSFPILLLSVSYMQHNICKITKSNTNTIFSSATCFSPAKKMSAGRAVSEGVSLITCIKYHT